MTALLQTRPGGTQTEHIIITLYFLVRKENLMRALAACKTLGILGIQSKQQSHKHDLTPADAATKPFLLATCTNNCKCWCSKCEAPGYWYCALHTR